VTVPPVAGQVNHTTATDAPMDATNDRTTKNQREDDTGRGANGRGATPQAGER
jgi:hypothetical protein